MSKLREDKIVRRRFEIDAYKLKKLILLLSGNIGVKSNNMKY